MGDKTSTDRARERRAENCEPLADRQTLIPPFDPEALAKELEATAEPATVPPPYDPSTYARLLDHDAGRLDAEDAPVDTPVDTPRTVTAATPGLGGGLVGPNEDELDSHGTGRAMYGSYLQSDYPQALVLAEQVLEREPDHALARLVADGCRERIGPISARPRLLPSSIVRMVRVKQPTEDGADLASAAPDLTSQVVLAHVDGVSDVTMLADLAGIPRPEALDRLEALFELGLLEVVNG